MTDTIFNDNPQATPVQPEAQTSSNLFTDQLNMIKNENGEQKYDNVPKALDALAHSQAYIPQLKTELQTKDDEIGALKEQLAKTQAVDDVVSRLTAKQETQGATPQTVGLDEQAVVNLIQNFTVQQQTEQVQNSNEVTVSNALVSKFGDKAQEVMIGKAQELGMSLEDLKGLAQKSPGAALQLFQVGGTTTPMPTVGSINIPASTTPPVEGLQPPTKSLLMGASTADQVAYMRQVKEDVYKKYNVTT